MQATALMGRMQNIGRVLAFAFAFAFAALHAYASPARAQELDEQRMAQVKSAYVLNFVRYTEWPPGTRADAYVITILGRSNLGRTFDQVIASASDVNGRPLRIKRIAYPEPALDGSVDPAAFRRFYDEIANTHVLFVGRSEASRLPQILARVGPAVLTVSDIPGFAANGGMLELVLDESRIVFEANSTALDNGGLRMSSKALKLARAIHGEGRGP